MRGLVFACLACFPVLLPAQAEAQARPRAGQPAAAAAGFPVRAIEVQGNTIYGTEELLAYATGFVQQQQGDVTLPAIAAAIERLYREDDYFLASVTPLYDPATGAARLVVDEGGVQYLEVLGVEEAIGARIAGYIRPVLTGAPLRMAEFERALMLAGDLSGVQVRAEFRRDPATGANQLIIHASARRYRISALIDNTPRQSAGNAFVSLELYSALTAGDMVRLVVGASGRTDWSDGGGNIAGFYRAPIGTAGTYVEVFAANTVYGRDSGGQLTDWRQQRGANAIALVGHPVLRDLDEFLYVMAEYDYAEIDFGGGGAGRDRSNTGRLMAYYTRIGSGGVTFRAGFTASAGAADSTRDPNVEPNFWHLRGVLGVVVPLTDIAEGLALRMEGYAQFSPYTLPETERFYLGDRDRMRGYEIGDLTGDSGVIGTFELSRHFAVDARYLQAVAPSLFFDIGMIQRNNDFPAVPRLGPDGARVGYSSAVLASTGIAARAFLPDGFVLSGWAALPLSEDGRGSYLSPTFYARLTKTW
ncbi:ShlB/FhaC/HecB family hemolysin secretion/activation protein [Roseomonas sp. PWR1]|uniref:ShlB/FhaC/HecB family hemolysin secretion/activation protein n=1 Tax=Roseomonas nitratireducens TaxID=2820810 RepID=A0ABS4ANS8_9PROT|nr:ShlB/FhaC/HecB family hemolysin secretion/activation protein [Neoroseomonas nitratireducens]MBP0462907.1 ShlB/FhaC/HecB family hemolysin secretion/activation protein [Neoroseomonas nitratireducens]